MSAAADPVSGWASLNSRVAHIYPSSPGGGADVSLLGIDRHFETVPEAVRTVEAMGLRAHVEPFAPTPLLVLAQSPALQVL